MVIHLRFFSSSRTSSWWYSNLPCHHHIHLSVQLTWLYIHHLPCHQHAQLFLYSCNGNTSPALPSPHTVVSVQLSEWYITYLAITTYNCLCTFIRVIYFRTVQTVDYNRFKLTSFVISRYIWLDYLSMCIKKHKLSWI